MHQTRENPAANGAQGFARLQKPQGKHNTLSTEASNQRARILEASKRQGGVTSMEARDALNIVDPPKRISELVAMGHKFAFSYERLYDHAGRPHPKCARYVWLSSPEADNG